MYITNVLLEHNHGIFGNGKHRLFSSKTTTNIQNPEKSLSIGTIFLSMILGYASSRGRAKGIIHNVGRIRVKRIQTCFHDCKFSL